MKACLSLSLVLVFALSSQLHAWDDTNTRRPNIVLILADDLGIGDVSAFNPGHIPTPNIDQLAARGVRFLDAHVSAAVCMPSRAGLLTGRQGTRHGSEFNAGPGLALNEQNIAELLKKHGYATGAIGKWHLGATDGREPCSQGFDEFSGLLGGGTHYLDPLDPQVINGFGVTAPRTPTSKAERDIYRGRDLVDEPEYLTDAFTREAVKFIQSHKSDPFFLYLAFNAPHTPHQTTKKYYDRFPEVKDHASRVYSAMVSAVDDGVGNVLQAIDEAGIEKDTLVIFLSDNGGPHFFQGGPSNYPYSGWKRYHLEGGHRTPLVISWPGKLPKGVLEPRLTSSLDIFPTIANAAGASELDRSNLDGTDLIPYLVGDKAEPPHRELFWRAGANFAIRDARWKLIVVNRTKPEDFLNLQRSDVAGLLRDGPFNGVSPLGQHVALYDLQSDIAEQTNVAAAHPEIVQSLREKYDTWDKKNVPPNAKSSRGIPTVIDGVTVQLAF